MLNIVPNTQVSACNFFCCVWAVRWSDWCHCVTSATLTAGVRRLDGLQDQSSAPGGCGSALRGDAGPHGFSRSISFAGLGGPQCGGVDMFRRVGRVGRVQACRAICGAVGAVHFRCGHRHALQVLSPVLHQHLRFLSTTNYNASSSWAHHKSTH